MGQLDFGTPKNYELIQNVSSKGVIRSLLWINANLWILTSDSYGSTIFRFNSKLRQIELNSLKIVQPSYCLLQVKNFIWIGGTSKIFIVDIQMKSMIKSIIKILDDDDAHGINQMISFGDYVFCANNSGFISVWNPQDMVKICSLQDERKKILSLCPIDDSTIASGSNNGFISTWNIKDWTKLNTNKYHEDAIKCILISEERSESFLWCGSLDKKLSRSSLSHTVVY